MIFFATDHMATFENEHFFSCLIQLTFQVEMHPFLSHCLATYCTKSTAFPTGIPVVIFQKFLVNSDAVYSFDKPGKLVEKRMVMLFAFFNFSDRNSSIIISDMDSHKAFYLVYW